MSKKNLFLCAIPLVLIVASSFWFADKREYTREAIFKRATENGYHVHFGVTISRVKMSQEQVDGSNAPSANRDWSGIVNVYPADKMLSIPCKHCLFIGDVVLCGDQEMIDEIVSLR